jgi:exodeoxyribonuclease VII small subunit
MKFCTAPLVKKKSMKKKLTFDKAFAELEKLVESIEDEKIQLDTLAEKVKLANELIRYCEISLRTISEAIEKEMTND